MKANHRLHGSRPGRVSQAQRKANHNRMLKRYFRRGSRRGGLWLSAHNERRHAAQRGEPQRLSLFRRFTGRVLTRRERQREDELAASAAAEALAAVDTTEAA